MSYPDYKLLHLLGLVLLLGNVTVTSVWKVFADRTGNPVVVAFAQRLVTITDWFLTLGGVLLLAGGGYGMALTAGIPVLGARWLSMSQLGFAISGAIWLGILVPTQAAQTRAIRAFPADLTELPAHYRRLSRRWITWGVIATIPLLAAMRLMILRGG
ncbi:MAG: DUF2269 domain-containing protein [Gemmatimonadaceae bacterium]|nr:DUF2269 domain-containing protein [Gemmatimonadaceae bacterium]